MEKITVQELLDWTGGLLKQGQKDSVIRSVSIDTRNLKRGDFFIPIAGENFDGHNFISGAAAKGASGSFFASGKFIPPSLTPPTRGGEFLPLDGGGKVGVSKEFILIEVPDTKKAFLALAENYRRKFKIPVIAITGSSGKTTTKELIAHILSASCRVMANAGNFNNEIGLPLSILKLSGADQAAVLEMGMNHPGEIANLSRAASPDFGLITNIGSAHLGFLHSKSRIAAAKAELLSYLKRGCAVLPSDDRFFPFLASFPVRERVTFGLKEGADYFPEDIRFTPEGTHFLLSRKKGKPLPLFAPIFGLFNLRNILAAAALTLHLGVSEDDLAGQLAKFKPAKHRFQVLKIAGAYIVDDTYNANPASFREALSTFRRLAGSNRKVIVAGSMAELGRFSRNSHLSLGRLLAQVNPDCLILVGPDSETVWEGASSAGLPESRILRAEDNQAAGLLLQKNLQPGTFAFLKGSRFLKLDEVVARFMIK
ncbi:MAG: UDP-N-acetylmuramoyl-tripeptide--D-alanyl-D-alanine ligase [Candidatus Omnitrophica bacterium]|nr:UDP-N-acetylmuramoyl-tripeptide--D-alanyl-D-alanine ligase [Candidatus Omnitrophota bacterium]